jgi:NTP pyrophosphatase (non-canonical NTP hydrolase)
MDGRTTFHPQRRAGTESGPYSTMMSRDYSTMNDSPAPITLADFQQLIDRMYSRKDAARGVDGTFMWLMEEIGELAAALRNGTPQELAAEFADVLAWLVTIANVVGIDLTAAVHEKYGRGCPGCGKMVCVCDDAEKP